MKIYLLDYENVGVDGFNGLSKLDANAKLVVFYSENRDKITFGLHRRLCESKAEIVYMRADVSNGKNALDFQLSYYAGVMGMQHPESDIFIVSKDKGYDSLIKIAHKQKCTICRVDDLTNYSVVSKNNEDGSNCDCNEQIPTLQKQIFDAIEDIVFADIDINDLSKNIYDFMCEYKSKSTINGHISKIVKNNDLHKEICKRIKPLLKDKS